MYVFGKNNNHLIKNNYKTTFSLPQKVKIITKPILKCACGPDFIIYLAQDYKAYCYFQAAVHNIDFKKELRIVDVQTEQNLILFVSQQGELYATEFLAEKLANDCLKPKPVRLSLPVSSSKDKVIKQVKIVDGNIFLKMNNNQLIHFKKNDWMETKSFSDPRLVIASKNCDIIDIKSTKRTFYFLAKDGLLYFTLENQLSSNFKRVEMKDKLKKIGSNKSQLFGINDSGQIIKIEVLNGRGKSQKLWKISTKFTDIKIGDENFYGITQNEEAWVWGKNSHGQLGLSDYEPRNCIYPLVSLQNYYIKNFFIGQNYCCCIVDDTKLRDPMKQKQKESTKSSFREMKSFSTQNNFIQCKDSLNQTEQFLMPIRYTEEESKSSFMDQNQSRNDTSGIKNKKAKEGKKINVFKKSLNNSKKPTDRESFKSSLKNHTTLSKISNKMADESSCRKSLNKSLRSNSKSFTSHSKSYISNSKFTPKSVTGHKSLFKGQKERSEIKNILRELDPNQSLDKSHLDKSHKREAVVSYKDSSNNKQFIKQIDSKSVHKQCHQNLQLRLKEQQIQQKQKMNALSEAFKMQKERLKSMIDSVQNELQLKIEENTDLYALLSEKNVTIADITQKIRLLQSAIEEHEKALTARDNQAEQFYLRQKDYQQHIQKLQNQVQKMMQVLNSNERNKQSEIYKKQMLRLSTEVKSRVQDEKQYYQERINSMQNKFDEERNLYQMEIRKLREQVVALGEGRGNYGDKGNGKLNQQELCINISGLENNSSHCMESPTFHTLDMKHNLKRKISDGYLLNQSQITLQDKVDESLRHPLQQSNRLYQTLTPMQKRYQQDLATKKNSRTKSFSSRVEFENDENKVDQKSQTQVKDILSKIQINKSFISKSANKLFNILENQKD